MNSEAEQLSSPFQRAQEAPEGWCMSVCTVRRAAQRLHCAAALLLPQPELHCRYDAGKCSILLGWTGKSRSLDVSAPVAGSVQPARKGHDSHGHAFSSSFSWGYWAHMYHWENPCAIRQESFSQEQGRSQAAQYWSHKAGSQESHFEKSCKLCKKHGGAHTTQTTKDCCKYEKDGTVKANFHTAKKAGKKPNPAKQLFAQLSEKLDKLEKTLKKASHKSKKRPRDDSDSDSK